MTSSNGRPLHAGAVHMVGGVAAFMGAWIAGEAPVPQASRPELIVLIDCKRCRDRLFRATCLELAGCIVPVKINKIRINCACVQGRA